MEFNEKVVIVTGGGKGIGEQISISFADEGAIVCIADVDMEAAEKVSARINKNGGNAIAIKTDVSNLVEVKDMVDAVVNQFEKIDILVNNAGIGNGNMVEELNEEDWRKVIDVNLTGPYLCSKEVIPYMKSRRSGKIINISSIASKRISFNGGASYTASKEGLLGFTRHLAYELAPFGINVNAVCPGGTMTPLYKRVVKPETLKERVDMIPKGKILEPIDQANAVLFLASDKADMICGIALDVDGGSLLGWMNFDSYNQKRKKTI